MNKTSKLTVACIVMSSCLSVYAQESIIGTYTGTYETVTRTGRTTSLGMSLTIDAVNASNVKATAKRTTGNCAGDYPMEGTLEDKKLRLSSTEKGGRGGDCALRLNVTLEGNKLVGTTNADRPITLSK